ncbi:MAG: acetolactate synthase small subunit [Acidobacteria bacterium]|nr:acetolactate synthase small subunit [Acidobacteriota bacterium]
MAVTLSVHVEDKPGSLDRVASLIRRRAFNIISLAVGRSEQPDVSRMTIVVDTDADGARRIEANLYKLLNVLQVQNITTSPSIVRDMALVKVAATEQTRSSVVQLAEVFRARIVDVAPDSLVIEITGTEDKVDGLVEVLRPYGVLELVRTGRIAIARGARPAARAEGPRQLPGQAPVETPGISCSV